MKSILQKILKLPFLGKQTSVRDELTGLIETSISNTDTEFDDQEGLLLNNMLGLRDITAEKVRCIYENDEILVTHQFNTYKSGDKEALMIVSLKKDGLIWKTETGATEM